MKTDARTEAQWAEAARNTERVGKLLYKLQCLNARQIAITTGPDKGPLDWYTINGTTIIVHLFAKGGWEVYAPVSVSLAIQDTLDALDRIANPQPLAIEEMHSIAPTGGTIAAMQPTAADRGAAKGIIDDPLWTAYDAETAGPHAPTD